jgi:hypothetical protein
MDANHHTKRSNTNKEKILIVIKLCEKVYEHILYKKKKVLI